MSGAIDYSDPCAVLAVLRPAYYALLAGSKAETIEFVVGTGSSRRVTYAKTDIDKLRAEMNRLEALCAAKTDGVPRRFATIGGSRL